MNGDPTEPPAPDPGEEVISMEAELPGPDEIEALIEPAGGPDVPDVPEETSAPPPSRGGAAAAQTVLPLALPALFPGAPPEDEPAAAAESIEGGEENELLERDPLPESRGSPRMVIAFASGKGGVGKSLITAGVGVYLAQLGKRITLVDASLGSGNLHTLLGVEEPRLSLHGFLSKEVKRIEEVVARTPFEGLGLISSHDNACGSTNPRPAQKTRLLNQLRTLAVDYLLLDLGSNSDFNTLDLFLAADLHVVVVTPEPTAIESAFRLVKSAFIRKIRAVNGIDRLIADLQPAAHCGIPSPHQIVEVARERDPAGGEAIYRAMGEFKPRLVVNMTRTRDDLELGPALAASGRRHLALPFDYLGYVENEDVAWVTVRKRRSLLVEYPETKIAKDIERVTRRILSLETKERPECARVPTPLARQDHYEVLDLHPGATEEEIRRAQRRVRRIYSPESPVIYGVVAPNEVAKMHGRIEEAYATLIDPEKRHLYDQRVFPGGPPPPPVLDESAELTPRPGGSSDHPEQLPLEERPEMPPITSETEFSGPLLRQVREARGAELQDIADRTKISIAYLRAIEEEDFLATPAPVYLRGFVKTVARDLRLDPEQVARGYMSRYEARGSR